MPALPLCLSGETVDMRGTTLFGAVGIFLVAAVPCLADDLELPPGPDRALVYGQCRTCHDLQYLIELAGIPRDSLERSCSTA